MLHIKPVDCDDCLQVINHLLSEYLGLSSYQIDKDKNVILTREDAGSEKLREAIDQLKASGIDASLISPDDSVHESDCSPIKRSKHSSVIGEGGDRFIRSVEHLAAVQEPSNWCQRGHNVPAWCTSVEPLSSLSSCISVLARIKPLPNVLGHVKRAFVKQLGQARVGKVLLGLAGESFTESDAVNLVSKLREITSISRAILENCRVPLCPPHSCRQQKALSSLLKGDGESRSWPFNFHQNQALESLLSLRVWEKGQSEGARPYFSFDEIKWHNHWLRRAIDLAESRSSDVKNASCDPEDPDCVCTCVVVRPHSVKLSDPAEAQPLAEAVSTDAKSCIDHATMLAASRVGRYAPRLDHAQLSSQDRYSTWFYNNFQDSCPKVTVHVTDSRHHHHQKLHHSTDADENVVVGHSDVYLLTGCDVYLSTEPCLMCAMALLHSRVKRVFIARRLPSIGGMCSRWKLPLVKGVNHHFLVFAPFEI